MSTSALRPKFSFFKHPIVRQAMLYAGLWMVVFVLLSMADRFLSDSAPQVHLVILMVLAVILGILNWWLLSKKLLVEESNGVKSFVTVLTTLVGIIIFFMMTKGTVEDTYYRGLYVPALSLFALPWFFMLAFWAHFEIPAWKYKSIEVNGLGEWLGKISFAEDQSRGFRWIFGEDFNESGQYSFRTLSPNNVKDYKMEDLFKGLLAFHNYNIDPKNPIRFEEVRWQFYHYSPWFFPKGKRMMNPKRTLTQNGVRFHSLSARQRENIKDIRDDLPRNFKYTTIYIQRIPSSS